MLLSRGYKFFSWCLDAKYSARCRSSSTWSWSAVICSCWTLENRFSFVNWSWRASLSANNWSRSTLKNSKCQKSLEKRKIDLFSLSYISAKITKFLQFFWHRLSNSLIIFRSESICCTAGCMSPDLPSSEVEVFVVDELVLFFCSFGIPPWSTSSIIWK